MNDILHSGKFSLVLIFAFQCQETIPTRSFACEIPVRGVYPNFNFKKSALPLKNANFAPHENFWYYYLCLYHIYVTTKLYDIIIEE